MFSNNLTIGKLQYTHDTQFELVINFIQNIIHLQKMSEDYGNFINKMAQNPLLVKIQARGNAYKQRAMILGLPAQVYRNIWMPFIEKKGFVNAAAHIERSLKGLVSDMLGRSEDSNTVDYVLRLVLPDIIAHKANKNAAQMLERVKLLKEKWNLTDKVVGGLLVFFQASLTEPKGQQVDKKTLNQLLSLFDTAESKIDYYYHAQETLNLAVAPTLYQLSQDRMSFEQIYQNMISCQRDCIISLLNKVNFKNRIITFGQMLSELCQIEGNEGRYSQMKKIATFFLLFYNWHHLKSEKSELKSKIVVSLIAQCFHRLMYILYDADNSVLRLFLVFLQFSSIQHYEQIKSKVSYHILALFKIKLKFQNPGFCQKLQSIWLQKFRDLKLSQAYIKQAPSFIRKNQRIQPSEKGQCQTISASYMIWSPLSRKTLSSRSKASKNRARQKHSWLRIIEQQLKRLDLEKVFLLLEGFRLFYTAEFNQSLPQIQRQATDIMRMLVAVMKQATQGLAHRFNPQQLYKVIKIELARIIAFCSFEMPFPESFFEDFGIFQLCYTDEKTINVESLVKLHLKYNYELNLKDLMAIRLIQQDIHQQSSKFNLQHLEKAFEEDCFQGRLLMLFKKDFQEGQNKNAKIFIIIGKLLAIKNANITNNLLVNYAHNMFSQENKEQITFSEKTLNFSTLINKQIVKNDCQQRVKVILNMGTIFDSFEVKRGIKSIPNSRKYFLFLRNTHHNKYFLNYYQIFKGYNYLIEAIHFLQLHYNRNPSILPSKKAKRQLLELYERLNEPFAENIKYIKKYNKLQDEKDQQKFQVQDTKFLLELATRSIDNQLGLQSCFNELFIEEFPKTGVWLYYYDNILTSLIQTIAQLQVSEQIFQKLLIFKILMGFISLKLKQSKKMGKNERQLEILVTMVQRVKDEKEQELFYKEMLKQLQLQRCFKQVQNLYLELLLKNNKSNLLTAYLREKTSNNLSQMYQKGYMKYIIRDLFQNKRYIECFSEIREYKKYSYQISPQIYEIQLESQYNIMMNFTIEDFLSFFENCTYPPQSKQVTQKHFDYYFKIFRMLFERYNFTKLAHNQVFLTHYFCFIDKNLVFTENIAYIQDIIFYLLRFVFEKFQVFGASNNYAERIIKKFKDHFNYFAPVCDYLINKISKNPVKNGIIRQLLVIVLSQYPNESIWTFCFLKNFSCGGKKQRYSAQQENEMQVISQIYSKAILLLEKNQKLNKEKVTFIDELTKAGFNKATQQKKGEQIKEKKVPQINEIKVPQIKEIKVPQGIYYVFDKQYTIHKIKSVQRLGNGKSVPLLITMQLFSDKTQNSKEVKVILKCNQECKNYRIESSTANFFYQIGLIDQETTYRIFHLSKYLVMVEYVLNCGTINSVIQSNFTEYKHLMSQVNAQFSKRAQNPKKKSENRALEIYDKFSQKITLRSSEILIKINKQIRNFRDWWTTYTNFVRTLAQWSYLGYVIGLGDRHYENILITQKAKLIHIDFQYALDIGYKLGCPQWVPFRLTKFLAEPLGILSSFGMLYGEMIEVAKRFKESQANAWKALALFVGFFQTNFTLELMNRSKFQKYEFSGTEQGIAHLIQSAQNPELLRRMFIGWRSYM